MTSANDATSVVSLDASTEDATGIVETGTMAGTTVQADPTATAAFRGINVTSATETTTPADTTASVAASTVAETTSASETTTPIDTTTSTLAETTAEITKTSAPTESKVAASSQAYSTTKASGTVSPTPSSAATDFDEFNSTALPTTATKGYVSTSGSNGTSTPLTIIGLEPWLFGVLVGAVVLALIIIIVVLLCLIKKRQRTLKLNSSRNPHWISDGAVQLSVIPREETWKSDSIEDKTTMYDGAATTVNVFDTDNQAYTSSPTIARLTQKQKEGAAGTDSEDTSSRASTELSRTSPKPARTLTKVNVPVIGTPSVSEKSEVQKTLSDNEDADSVFTTKSDTTPQRNIGQSMDSFKTTSPAKQSDQKDDAPAPSDGKENSNGALPPPPPPPPADASPKVERDVTGAPVADSGDKERQRSFLHSATANSDIPPPPPV